MKKRILLVDDDQMVLQVVRSSLEHFGYEVLFEANSGNQAIKTFRKNMGSIDLVFTDCEMKDGNGIDLIRAVKSLSPSTPIVMASGNLSIYTQAAFDAGVTGVLAKPFLLRELRDVMAKALSEASVVA